MNCQRCVIAHEMRMRGFDVVARPSYGADDTLRNAGKWLGAFDYSPSDFVKITGKTGEEVINSAVRMRKLAAAKILGMADLKSDIFLVRVDKLKLTEIVKRCAMPKE